MERKTMVDEIKITQNRIKKKIKTVVETIYSKVFPERFISRDSCMELFCKKGVLRNFTKFKGKHLYRSLSFNKVAGPRPATLLKKETLVQVFSCEFCELCKNTFLIEHLCWLPLHLGLEEHLF